MRRFFAVAVFAAVYTEPLAAEQLCLTGAAPPTAGLAERALILAETEGPSNRWSDYRGDQRGPAMPLRLLPLLQTLGLETLLPEANPRSLPCDTPYQGEILATRVRALGARHPYIARLAANQVRALSNCYNPEDTVLPERNWSDIKDPARALASLAEDDFAYLVGVAHFLKGNQDAARAAFAAVAADAASPHRDAGRLMEIRSLRALGAVDEAYALAKRYRIEANDAFKTALDEQEDIIAQYSSSTGYAAAHLEKVYRRVSGLPIENEPRGFRVRQAYEDFDLYFMNEFKRLKWADTASLPHDWWLREEPPASRRAFIAIHQLAGRYDGIDWVAAHHASVAFDRDNTWFAGPDIDIEDPAYRRVTEHAYRKWKKGARRWAMIVAERMAPTSRHVGEIAALAARMEEEAASCALSAADYDIYQRLTQHLVRVDAMNGDYKKAIDRLLRLHQNLLYQPGAAGGETSEALIKLLAIRGEYELIARLEEARRLQLSRRNPYRAFSYANRFGSLWTAATTEDLIADHFVSLASMTNMMSTQSLEAMLSPPAGKRGLRPEHAARASAVLWMRAFLLGDEALMARVEPRFVERHPRLKRYFRQAAAAKSHEARDFALAVMVLRNPGLTPYYDELRLRRTYEPALYDSHNPVEGNWWCAAADRALVGDNEKRLEAAFFGEAFRPTIFRRTPDWGRITRPGYSSAKEDALIEGAWRRFRSSYRPFGVITDKEQARLATLPRASEWLAGKVRAYIESPAGLADRAAPHDERIPESLHLVVEATRYSCHTLERGNGKTSLWAYTTLHRHYGDTTWAAETPFWHDRLREHRR